MKLKKLMPFLDDDTFIVVCDENGEAQARARDYYDRFSMMLNLQIIKIEPCLYSDNEPYLKVTTKNL